MWSLGPGVHGVVAAVVAVVALGRGHERERRERVGVEVGQGTDLRRCSAADRRRPRGTAPERGAPRCRPRYRARVAPFDVVHGSPPDCAHLAEQVVGAGAARAGRRAVVHGPGLGRAGDLADVLGQAVLRRVGLRPAWGTSCTAAPSAWRYGICGPNPRPTSLHVPVLEAEHDDGLVVRRGTASLLRTTRVSPRRRGLRRPPAATVPPTCPAAVTGEPTTTAVTTARRLPSQSHRGLMEPKRPHRDES